MGFVEYDLTEPVWSHLFEYRVPYTCDECSTPIFLKDAESAPKHWRKYHNSLDSTPKLHASSYQEIAQWFQDGNYLYPYVKNTKAKEVEPETITEDADMKDSM